jgi:triosephosphate isomerase
MLLGVSLKTYKTPSQTKEYISKLDKVFEVARVHDINFFIIPDIVSLGVVPKSSLPTHVILGAQDCFWEDNGAYTGTISPKNLSELGVQLVELGHAEQRRIFGETDERVAAKAIAAVRNGLTPLLCIGELTADSRTAISTCIQQIRSITQNIPDDIELVVAYEPVWAIGQANPAKPKYVIEVTNGIRAELSKRKGRTRILYGGSAGPGLFKSLYPSVDGLFLGRFGHNTESVVRVIEEMAQAKEQQG